MTQFKAKARAWGNSLGIILPSEVVQREHITPDQDVIVEIKAKNVLKETFGSLKAWKIDSQKVKDQLRKEWA